MNSQTQKTVVEGAAGAIEVAIDGPSGGLQSKGMAVIAHPHPLFGGTMDNKVVQTMARALLGLGCLVIVLNYARVFGEPDNWRLVVGLAAILGGIITATNYR